MGHSKIAKKSNILKIVDRRLLQNVQDFFANTMGFASLTVNDKGPITGPSNFTDFCSKYIRGSCAGSQRCNECDIKWGNAAAESGKPAIYTCHAGLTDFAVPIVVEGEHVASILGGQVLTEEPDEERFRQLARELDIEEDEFIEALNKIKIIPVESVEAATNFLSLVANAISAIAHANSKLSEFGLDYKMPRSMAFEEWFFLNCENIKHPISAREFEVLKLIVLGKSNTEIAKELFISVHTAKAHVSSILEKFLVEDRVQVAVKAVREGLI